MNQITKEALDFLNEAKEGFEKNDQWATYTNKDNSHIALRTGFRDDCIMVYELGNPVGNFVQQLPSQHKVLVDYDEFKNLKDNYSRLKDIELDTEEIAEFLKRNFSKKGIYFSEETHDEIANTVFDLLVQKDVIEEVK